jgi:FKBP-type peptidyl-prolyl cis-trans isomerase FkpA
MIFALTVDYVNKSLTMIKNNIKKISVSLTTVIMITLISCDPGRKYEKEEASQIEAYLVSNFNITFDLKPSGLYYHEILAGTGNSPVAGDSVFVRSTGMFLSGYVFAPAPSAGKSYGFPIGVGLTITGFDEGIYLMKVGGKATLLIPSKLAYGPMGSYNPYYGYQEIPGYTPLLFDVELTGIKSPSVK